MNKKLQKHTVLILLATAIFMIVLTFVRNAVNRHQRQDRLKAINTLLGLNDAADNMPKPLDINGNDIRQSIENADRAITLMGKDLVLYEPYLIKADHAAIQGNLSEADNNYKKAIETLNDPLWIRTAKDDPEKADDDEYLKVTRIIINEMLDDRMREARSGKIHQVYNYSNMRANPKKVPGGDKLE